MALPNFFIVGAPKAGTTALHGYLSTHPRIFMPANKEPHFFARDWPALAKSPWHTLEFSDYETLFKESPHSAQAVGEASVWYLFSRIAIERIQEFNPRSKLIICLRHPVELAESLHGNHLFFSREDIADFPTAWRLQDARARGESLPRLAGKTAPQLQYGEVASLGRQVAGLLETFPREQAHFVLLDDFKTDPRGAYLECLAFLGVADDGRRDFPPANAAREPRFGAWLARNAFRPPVWAQRSVAAVKKVIPIEDFGISRLAQRICHRPRRKRAMTLAFRRELAVYFSADIDLLESLIGRDLSGWKGHGG